MGDITDFANRAEYLLSEARKENDRLRAALAAAQAAGAYRKVGIDPLNPNPDGSDIHLMNAIDAAAQAAGAEDRRATFMAGFIDFRDKSLMKFKDLEGPLLSKGAIAYVCDVLRALSPPAFGNEGGVVHGNDSLREIQMAIEIGMEIEPTKEYIKTLDQQRRAKKRERGFVMSKDKSPGCWRVWWVGFSTPEILSESFIRPRKLSSYHDKEMEFGS